MPIPIIKATATTPEFRVNLPKPSRKLLVVRVAEVAVAIIKGVGILTYEFARSTINTLKTSGTAFKVQVLGYYGNGQYSHPKSAMLLFLRISHWMFLIGYSILENTVSATAARYHTQSLLKAFIPEGMNESHIVTHNAKIDVSDVPPDVTVDSLLTIFDEINFTDNTKAGWVDPVTLREEQVYLPATVKTKLQVFLTNVKGRIPFLGTPPRENVPKLLEFYLHIENCVRAAIHASKKSIAKFEEDNGKDYSKMDDKTKKEYDTLLKRRAQIAINMGIAGMHCGGRYMGEATNSYYDNCGDANNFLNDTLQVAIQEILAQERRKIADIEIAKVSNDTHYYSAYMEALGEELAIPGSGSVSEHLQNLKERDKKLASFFETYTINHIIETVNDKIKKSQSFRALVIGFMQANIGQWNNEKYEKMTRDIVAEVRPILQAQLNGENSLRDQVEFFRELVNTYELTITDELSLNDYLDELLAERTDKISIKFQSNVDTSCVGQFREELQTWLNENEQEEKYKHLKSTFALIKQSLKGMGPRIDLLATFHKISSQINVPIDGNWVKFFDKFFIREKANELYKNATKSAYVNTLKLALLNPKIKPFLEQIAKKEVVSEQELAATLQEIEKVKRVTEILIKHKCPHNEDSVARIVKGELKVVKDLVEQLRAPDFSAALKLDDIVAVDAEGNDITRIQHDGLSSELLEWILVSQGVLHPQEYITPDPKDNGQSFTKDEKKFLNRKFDLTHTGDENDYLTDLVAKVVAPGSDSMRYKGELGKELILRKLFEKVYSENSEKLLKAYEANGQNVRAYSPVWRAVWIQLPTKISEVTGNLTIRVAVLALAIFATGYVAVLAFNGIQFLAVARGIPLLINNVPGPVINVLSRAAEAVMFLANNFVTIGYGVIFTSWLIRKLPPIPILTDFANNFTLARFTMLRLRLWWMGQSTYTFVAARAFEAYGKLDRAFNWISAKSGAIAHESQLLAAAQTKAKFYSIWKKSFMKFSAEVV